MPSRNDEKSACVRAWIAKARSLLYDTVRSTAATILHIRFEHKWIWLFFISVKKNYNKETETFNNKFFILFNMRWVVSINPLATTNPSFIAEHLWTGAFFSLRNETKEKKELKKKSRKDEQQYKLEWKVFIRLYEIMGAKE